MVMGLARGAVRLNGAELALNGLRKPVTQLASVASTEAT